MKMQAFIVILVVLYWAMASFAQTMMSGAAPCTSMTQGSPMAELNDQLSDDAGVVESAEAHLSEKPLMRLSSRASVGASLEAPKCTAN